MGIPCGIGIGSTKTLAKLANHIAKTSERNPGSSPEQVCNRANLEPQELAALMQATKVAQVWGVGRRTSAQLGEIGVVTALDLARLDPSMVKRRWSTVLERTVRELQGTDCIGLEQEPPAKQQIACTRSFGQSVLALHELQQAVTEFASRAAQKARLQNSHAAQVLVFIRTSPFRAQDLQCSGSTVVPLRRASNDTRDITQVALMGLDRIFRHGHRYAKAGGMLLDLQPAGLEQQELSLDGDIADPGASRLMQALDTVNQRYGRGTLTMASAGLGNEQRSWNRSKNASRQATPQTGKAWHW